LAPIEETIPMPVTTTRLIRLLQKGLFAGSPDGRYAWLGFAAPKRPTRMSLTS
jgi:hypothetical protein